MLNPAPFTFHKNTPEVVRNIIQSLYQNKHRARFHFGDTNSGRDWMEENYVTGYVGKSTGSQPIPLLVHNSRSFGGGGLLDHCIVKITDIYTGRILYQHPRYNQPRVTVQGSEVFFDGELQARCKNDQQAWRLAAFYRGDRHAK